MRARLAQHQLRQLQPRQRQFRPEAHPFADLDRLVVVAEGLLRLAEQRGRAAKLRLGPTYSLFPIPCSLRRLLAQVEDGDDVGMATEAAHRLGLARDALAGGVVEAIGLDQGEGDVAVERRVVGEVDALLAALAQEALDDVAAGGEGGGYRSSFPSRGEG